LKYIRTAIFFNDGAFEIFTEKSTKPDEALFLEQGKPLIFGATQNKGIKLDGFSPVVVNLNEGFSADELWVHDEKDFFKAQMLIRMFDNPAQPIHFSKTFWCFL